MDEKVPVRDIITRRCSQPRPVPRLGSLHQRARGVLSPDTDTLH